MRRLILPKKRYRFIVPLGLMMLPLISGAEQKACMETATTQLEQNQCAAIQLKSADDELNRVYQAILSEYKADGEFIAKLRRAQHAWLAFRGAELEARFPMQNKQSNYGSAYPMCANLFLARLTKERIKQLRVWLDGVEEGDVCAGSVHFKSGP